MTGYVFKAAMRDDPVIKFLGSGLPFIRRSSASPYWAIATAGLALLTIISCYFTAMRHLPVDRIEFPPIAYTCHLYPERYINLIGSLLVFLCFLITTRQLHVIHSRVLNHTILSRLAASLLNVSLIGILYQALFSVQEYVDTLHMNHQPPLTVQSMMHLAGEGMFFVGLLIHGVLMIADRIYRRTAYSIRMPFIIKGLLLLFSFAVYQAGYVHIYGGPMRDLIGLGQRFAVLFIFLFFADYARDVRKVLSEVSQPDQV